MAAPQLPSLQHAGPWTFDEWLELPEGHPRVELVDGLLVMSPLSGYPHQRLMLRIWQQLNAAAPGGVEVMPEVNVRLGADRALIPDFGVIDRLGFDGVILSAEHFRLVGEIASPSTRVYDRTVKRELYAEAGVPYLLMVEPADSPTAVCYELAAGEYVEMVRSVDGVLELVRPFPVTLHLASG